MIILMMGVSGSGKTTIGRLLADQLNWPFYEGDDFHPPANIAKMSQGIPLDDADRAPWLAQLGQLMDELIQDGRSAVLTCSALKKEYRDSLRQGRPQLKLVYLQGTFHLIHDRLEERSGHYMRAGMLSSQFEALEEPAGEGVLVLAANLDPATLVEQICQTFEL